MTTPRTLTVGAAITAALLTLTGCASDTIKHGEVIDKRHSGRWIPEYEDVYRENCTTIRTSSYTTTAFAGRSGGSSGGKSGSGRSTSGKTGSSGRTGRSNPDTSSSSGGTGTSTPSGTGNSSQPSKQCERQYVGQKQTGQHWQGKWELQLRDGDRTGWITVSQTTYNDTDLHDHI
ncbi:hypothetical protein [Streptomyces lavendulae]|uniref:hypothetical protein n=1 Tax=Streptomyces lavendulae TaxID=1914 RepID=UPI0024A583EF|nr:hypothetical protein [Streptomyces lavendulae]GLX22645.1 hypothetical protein Slala01_62890 [Streptomyces lavendulae subsp. lavendulae]GLX30128.1 hypothetical protein Slala02_59480 [Streptomyces lavendulae subsp. lavendulae]